MQYYIFNCLNIPYNLKIKKKRHLFIQVRFPVCQCLGRKSNLVEFFNSVRLYVRTHLYYYDIIKNIPVQGLRGSFLIVNKKQLFFYVT